MCKPGNFIKTPPVFRYTTSATNIRKTSRYEPFTFFFLNIKMSFKVIQETTSAVMGKEETRYIAIIHIHHDESFQKYLTNRLPLTPSIIFILS